MLRAGVISVALCLLWATTASAATATVETAPFSSDRQVSFVADPGEVNDLVITSTGATIVFEDAGAAVVAGAGCAQVTPNRVECTDPAISRIHAKLEDGDDRGRQLAVPPIRNPQGFQGSDATVEGGAGRDVLRGGDGHDLLMGGAGGDDLAGGRGGDALIGSEFSSVSDEDDVLDGGEGDDYVEGLVGNNLLSGGPGADILNAGGGTDVLDAGPGDDQLDGGAGDDVLLGGEGADRLEVVTIFFNGSATTTGRDRIDAGPGDDLIGRGRDPGAGERVGDRIRGGDGEDTVEYVQRTQSLVVDLDDEADDGAAGEGDDVGSDVERVSGGSDSDTLVGSATANVLDGRGGDDLLRGLGGADTLDGGAGDGGSDSLEGGEGADTLRGQAGDDSLDGGAGNDSVSGGGGADGLTGGEGADVVAGGAGIDRIEGAAGDDLLRGGDIGLVGADGGDDIDGGEGADTLEGGAGNDRLDGGPGADRLSGQEGRDTADYSLRGGAVTVTFDGSANDGEPGEGDGVGSDVEIVLGSAAPDTLSGDPRSTSLDGGSGEDLLDGGSGVDQLAGGTGIDVLRSRDGVRDVVSCGQESDLAIVDLKDVVRDCELVDRGHRQRARLGRDLLIAPARGSNEFRLPDGQRFIPLRERLPVPLGSAIDSRDGTVAVTAAKDRRGTPQSAQFYGGVFSVHQKRRDPETEVRLTGGDFSRCPRRTSGRTATAAAHRRVRGLWGRVSKRRGRFRARGRYSAAGVRGTTWLVEDRCDGTYTRVVSGTVVVEDFARARRVVLRGGQSYLARAPRRGR